MNNFISTASVSIGAHCSTPT